MFIYKITVLPINKVYIGLDTHEEYKKFRWKFHCREVRKAKSGKYNKKDKTKLFKAMYKYGLEQCQYEVIDRGFETISKLALAEIKYIKEYDSYRNGLNSTLGGDGLSDQKLKKSLTSLSEEEFEFLKNTFSQTLSDYNNNVKWANTTAEQRKEMTQHLRDPENIKMGANALKEYYKAHPEAKKEKSRIFKKWIAENKDLANKKAARASQLAIEVNQKYVKVQEPNGEIKFYPSRKKFYEASGLVFTHLLNKGKVKGFVLLDYGKTIPRKVPTSWRPMVVQQPSGEIKTYASRKEFTKETGISSFYFLKKGKCKGYILING